MGILLAYHALAYICAGLRDAGAAEILPADSVTRALADMGHRRDEARMTMQGARENLTDVGRTFLERTHQVADYAAA
jgi:hypothetical protein